MFCWLSFLNAADCFFDPPFYFCWLKGMAVSLFYREAFILMSADTVRWFSISL